MSVQLVTMQIKSNIGLHYTAFVLDILLLAYMTPRKFPEILLVILFPLSFFPSNRLVKGAL